MHSARRQIAMRWGAYLLALLSPALFFFTAGNEPQPVPPLSESAQIVLPTQADENALARCVAVLEGPPRAGDKASNRVLQEPRNRYLDIEGQSLEQVLSYEWEKKQPLPHLSLVFVSGTDRMAILDGRVVRQGSRLQDGSRVLRIERNGVFVRTQGTVRRIPWQPPEGVLLSRSVP